MQSRVEPKSDGLCGDSSWHRYLDWDSPISLVIADLLEKKKIVGSYEGQANHSATGAGGCVYWEENGD